MSQMDKYRLEHVFKKSKSTFGWNSITEFEHGKDEKLVNQ
jgi:hypothetical protein